MGPTIRLRRFKVVIPGSFIKLRPTNSVANMLIYEAITPILVVHGDS